MSVRTSGQDERLSAPRFALALDSSSAFLSVALWGWTAQGGRWLARHHAQSGALGQRMVGNRTLVPLLRDLFDGAGLRPQQLDLVVVGCGPGSFTGTRLGLTVTLGLQQVTGVALCGVSTLEVLAQQADWGEETKMHAVWQFAPRDYAHGAFRRTVYGPRLLGAVVSGSLESIAARVGADAFFFRRDPTLEAESKTAGASSTLRDAQPHWPAALSEGRCLPSCVAKREQTEAALLVECGLGHWEEQLRAAPRQRPRFPRPEPLYLKAVGRTPIVRTPTERTPTASISPASISSERISTKRVSTVVASAASARESGLAEA